MPVAYEAAPRRAVRPRPRPSEWILDPARPQAPSRAGSAEPPDVGFFGRDETLLGLDRAFDDHQVVLL